MPTTFERRTRRCQAALRERDAGGIVLFPGPNLYYLAGVDEGPSERHFLCVVPAEGEPGFVVPELSAADVRDATWVDDVRAWADADDPVDTLESLLDDRHVGGRVLLDDRLWATFVQDLRALLPDADFGLASEVLKDLRLCKDDRELDAMRAAAAVADDVAASIRDLGADAVGMTEAELAREIDARLRERGDHLAFETIVASGPNGARPHHHHGEREIAPGDPVVLDFGCFLDHYPSDQTRTVVFDGEPPTEFQEAFDAVRDAQRAGVEVVEPGVPAAAVDRAAREVIEGRGYGDAFVHRTGHGVGLEVHEPPYIVAGNERELEPGMVFSVEPGVYLEGEFGVRIEDLVVVTETGYERLNGSPRGWRV